MILIVEDDEELAASLAEMLEEAGHESHMAHSAEAALGMMRETHYDVVILDMVMEGMGGMGFLARYELIDPSSQVIVLTAYPSLDTAVPALSGGVEAPAVAYLEKPVESKKLLALIRESITLLRVNEFELDVRKRKVTFQGESLKLPKRSFDLFTVFMSHPDEWLTYADIAKLLDDLTMDKSAAAVKYKSTVSRMRSQLQDAAGYEVVREVGQNYGFALLRKKG